MQTRSHVEDNTIHLSRSHIETLKARRSAISDNTTTVANMISQQMHQLFHDPKCFIYEIIQNAEDAEADSIAFKIENNDLIISYNGKPFQQHDIERVCDASRDNDPDSRAKSNQSEKIGYKGIGFKSVFGISSEIAVLSPKTCYFFQFSKSYWDAKTTELIRFPWQIIPLWLEPEEYRAAADNNFKENVTIILKNVDCQKIIPELMTFVMLDERLVFLNKIQKIEFFHQKNYYSIQKTHKDFLCHITRTQRHFEREEKCTALWHMHRATVPIEEDITEKLARLDLSSCPEKIKSAKSTEIMFASKIELLESGEYDFLPPRDSKLYCYLPTSIDCHLPFLVNARFILNQDRSMIINNTWNSFVIKSIAIQHLKWLAELALNPRYSTHILKIFSPKKSHEIFPQLQRKLFQDKSGDEAAQESLLQSYEEGVIDAQRNIAFIPAKDGALLNLSEYRIDTTDFFIDIDEKLLDENLFIQGRSLLVAYKLKNRDALVNLASEYNFNHLLGNIEKYFYLLSSDIAKTEVRSKMMIFILKSDNGHIFFEKKIMVCTNRQFHSRDDSFILPATSDFTSESLAIFQINLVDLTLYSQECVKKLSKVIDKVSAASLIKKQIKKMIEQGRINEKNSISILRFIYSACLLDIDTLAILQDTQQEKFNFPQFKVLTGDGQLREIRQCFLPLQHTEKVRFLNHQLNSGYFSPSDNVDIFNKILTYGHIQTATEIENLKNKAYSEIYDKFSYSKLLCDLLNKYTSYIINEASASSFSKVVREKLTERIIFLNFIYFPFILYLEDSNILSLFLTKLNSSQAIYSISPEVIGKKDRGENDRANVCEHFLTYYFKRHVKIKVKGFPQKSWLAGELFYLPELLDSFDPTQLPIYLADLPVSINMAIANFLGFRLSITLKEGLQLLSTLNEEIARKRKLDSIDFDRLRAIYRLIIKVDLTREDVSIINVWKDKHSLLSRVRTFEPSVHLKIFDQNLEDGLACPDTMHWLHDVNLSNSELKTLANILNITCYSEDQDFTANVSSVQDELTSAENLKKFVLSLLPALTLMEEKEYGISPQEFHIKIFDYINALHFEYCSDITFKNGYKPRSFARISGDYLYFTGRLMHIKVCEILSLKLQSKRAQEWLKNMMQLFPSEQGNAALIDKKIQDIATLNPAVYNQLSLYQTSKAIQSSFKNEGNTITPVMIEEQQSTSSNRKVVNNLFSSPGSMTNRVGNSTQGNIGQTLPGLLYQKIPGDGHCLYNAIALHIDLDTQIIRNLVAADLKYNKIEYEPIVAGLLIQGQTFESYVNGIISGEWGDNLELSILMRLLDRAILVVHSDRRIEHIDAVKTYPNHDPIFVFYNGHNHYDAFIRNSDLSGRQIVEQLTQLNEHSQDINFNHHQGINPLKTSWSRSPVSTATGFAKNDSSTTSTPLAKVRSTLFDFDPDSPVTLDPRHINQEKHLRPLGNKPMNSDNATIAHSSNVVELDEEKMAEKEATNKNIGDRGEEIVFRKIVHLLEKQWEVTPENVTINDPELGQGVAACRFIKDNGLKLDLIWYNRDRGDLQTIESPVDMIIAVNGEQRYFIEIKSTASKSYPTFFLTANEWKYMQAKRQQSILVRAYNVNEAKARFEVYQDPFGMICENLITFAGDGKFELKIKSPEKARQHIFEEDPVLGCKVS